MAEDTLSTETNQGATVSGRVHSHSGALLNGAKVTCSEFETLTLADGYYSFNHLNAGTFEVTVNLQGYQPGSKTVTVSENDTALLDFSLTQDVGTATIHGYIYDDETQERILNSGTVILVLPISNKYAPIDGNGYYEFAELSEGSYRLVTSIPEYHDHDAAVSLHDGETKNLDFFCKKTHIVDPAWG
jgi:uncharacterized membrane protein